MLKYQANRQIYQTPGAGGQKTEMKKKGRAKIKRTSAGRGLVRVADGDSTPHRREGDVDDVLEPLPLELGAVRVQVRAGEHDLRLPLHGRVPVILDGVVGAPGHHLRDLRPLVAELLVLDEDRVVLERPVRRQGRRVGTQPTAT